ncbi:TIGR02281 family clan AA aspartic protease [Parvibaculaceae bacterium PLY_AMNH_Bact1]|nr:TIGR02281 family clan AA aspartic protease [Parvibaculaceae bacterium PLY_AMNH_Bact1]
MRRNTWTWVGLAGLTLTAFLFAALQTQPRLIAPLEGQSSLLPGLSLLGLVALSVLVGWRANAGLALRQAMSWVAIALTLVIGYGYRHNLTSVLTLTDTQLLAKPAVRSQPGVVSLGGAGNGHFFADANVDGTHVRFLVDTGASHVALTPFDAQRLGLDVNELEYRVPYQTANGTAYAALVTLDEVSVGSISVRGVRASVSQGGLSQSLLGMSFLSKLSAVELSGDRLMLRE